MQLSCASVLAYLPQEAVLALNELQTPDGIVKKIVQSGREQAYPQYFQKALQYTKSVGLEV